MCAPPVLQSLLQCRALTCELCQLMLSNDQLTTLREPRLLLNLTTAACDGSKEDVIIEMSKKDLDRTIAQLSGAAEVINGM